MTTEKCYCVVEFEPRGFTVQIRGIFTTRNKADTMIFELAKECNVPDGHFMGISEQWRIRRAETEASQPSAPKQNGVPAG